MDKNEILEKNRSSQGEDEREVFINGKASLAAKGAFILAAVCLKIYRESLGLKSDDISLVILAYFAMESMYKYYYLRRKSLLIWGIIFLAVGTWSAISIFTKGL